MSTFTAHPLHAPWRAPPEAAAAFDLFLLCTRESAERREVEGFGLVFLDAQACAGPRLWEQPRVTFPMAVKEGEGGWLIEQDDAVSLSKILSRLVDEPAAFHEMGARTREHVWSESAPRTGT